MIRVLRFSSRLIGPRLIPPRSGIKPLLFKSSEGCSVRFVKSYCHSNELEEELNDRLDNMTEEDEESESDSDLAKHQRKSPIHNSLKEAITECGDDIDWNKVISTMLERTTQNRMTIICDIITVCEKEKLFNAITSYFRYLIKSKELTVGFLYLFCTALSRNREHLKECEEIVYDIFVKLPPGDAIPLKLCASALSNSPEYGPKVTDTIKQNNLTFNNTPLIQIVLGQKDEEAAFKQVKLMGPDGLARVIPHFLNYFKSLASTGVVPLTQFVRFFDELSNKQVHSFPDAIVNLLEDLFKELNEIDESFVWSFHETSVSRNACRTCNGTLKKVSVSQKEVDTLMEHFEKNVIFKHSINIRSNKAEWERFITYLKKKPYDIVLDGLNILYFYKKSSHRFVQLIEKIDDLELTPLILARKHFTQSEEYQVFTRKYPVFLTDNLSDDDVFVLYAALRKGKKCYAVSRDQMGFARSLIGPPDITDMFLRWQATHQCCVTRDGNLEMPAGYPFGYQKSVSERKDEFRYHVVVRKYSKQNVYCISRVKK